MAVVDGVFKFITGVVDFVMPVIVAIIKGAWGLIQNTFNTAIGVIMGIIKVFSSLLTGDCNGIKDSVIRIWKSLWDSIKGLVSVAWAMISGVVRAFFGRK